MANTMQEEIDTQLIESQKQSLNGKLQHQTMNQIVGTASDAQRTETNEYAKDFNPDKPDPDAYLTRQLSNKSPAMQQAVGFVLDQISAAHNHDPKSVDQAKLLIASEIESGEFSKRLVTSHQEAVTQELGRSL